MTVAAMVSERRKTVNAWAMAEELCIGIRIVFDVNEGFFKNLPFDLRGHSLMEVDAEEGRIEQMRRNEPAIQGQYPVRRTAFAFARPARPSRGTEHSCNAVSPQHGRIHQLSQSALQQFPVDSQHDLLSGSDMSNQEELDFLRGTLDMLVLKTLATLGAQHGYGIARRIEQVSDEVLGLNQGTLYPALLRLEQQGLISSDWGVSENNRRARFYSLTRSGRARLKKEITDWQRMTTAVNNIIAAGESNPA